jgi:hypothetical protein
MNATISAGWLLLGSALLSLACTDAGSEPRNSGSLGATRQRLRVDEAVVGPLIGPQEPVPVPLPIYAQASDVTSDGEGFFVVAQPDGEIELRGSLLGPQGDPVNVGLSLLSSNSAGALSVAFGAQHYLALQSSYDEEFYQGPLQAVLIDRDGHAEGPGLPLEAYGDHPSLAWNGSHFGASWQDSGVVVALLDAQGQLLSQQLIHQSAFFDWPPRLAAGRSHFLVTWTDAAGSGTIAAARVGFDGQLEDPTPLQLATGVNGLGVPAVASNGARFLVTWVVGSELPRSIHGAIIDEGGALLIPDFEISHTEEEIGGPAVASDGTDFVVVWAQGSLPSREVVGARVTASAGVSSLTKLGEFGSDGPAVSPDLHRGPRLSWNGSDYLLAVPSFAGVLGVLFGRDLTPKRSELSFLTTTNTRSQATSTWDGVDYRLSWNIGLYSPSDWKGPVRGTRIAPTGAIVEPAVLSLSGEQLAIQHQIASAGNGEMVTVWRTPSYSAWYSKSTASGESTPPVRLSADSGFGSCLGLASDGESYLAVSCQPIPDVVGELGETLYSASGTLFDRSGRSLRTFAIPSQSDPFIQLVGAIQSGYLIGFNDGESKIARFDRAGELVAVETISSDDIRFLGSARGASSTLVLMGIDGIVHARFYGDSGWQGDNFVLPDVALDVSAAFDGSEYWLAWSLSPLGTISPAGIRLENITPDGDVGPVVPLPENGLWPNLAGSPDGQLLLSYSVPDLDAGGSSRIFSRLLSASIDAPAGGAGSFGGASAVGGGAGPAAGGESTLSAGGGSSGAPELTGGVAGSSSGGPQAGGFNWPGGVGPLPSCSYAERSQTGGRTPLSSLAAVALTVSLRLARRKRKGPSRTQPIQRAAH